MRTAVVILMTLVLIGCHPGKQDGRAHDGVQADTSLDSQDYSGDGVMEGSSFGIANEFSGELSKEQEDMVPDALRGAFYVESLQTITPIDLATQLEHKTQVAEETHQGKRYVALEDIRHAQISGEASAHVLVIERYLVIAE